MRKHEMPSAPEGDPSKEGLGEDIDEWFLKPLPKRELPSHYPIEWSLQEKTMAMQNRGMRKILENVTRAADMKRGAEHEPGKKPRWAEGYARGYSQGAIDNGTVSLDYLNNVLSSVELISSEEDKKWLEGLRGKLEKKSDKKPLKRCREMIFEMFDMQYGKRDTEELEAKFKEMQGATDGYIQSLIDHQGMLNEEDILNLIQKLRSEYLEGRAE